jgi:MFS transporter, YNFM family, putative membrane transport protein
VIGSQDRAMIAKLAPKGSPRPREDAADALALQERPHVERELARFAVIAAMAFLTLVDLFGTQAILPALAAHYGATPAQTGLAVNATTLGMAIASLGIAIFSRRIDRRAGVVFSLCALAVPTALLAFCPNLQVFAALRVAQGLCMASAFVLTLAYLGEHTTGRNVAGAFAAYITGNVVSNLIGRLSAAFFTDHLGLSGNFLAFAVLNIFGAGLAASFLERAPKMAGAETTGDHPLVVWRRHLETPGLAAAFAVGFCILFAFVGAFSYVNFVLAQPPHGLGMMQIGLVYLVFLPSIVTTALGGRLAAQFGASWVAGGALLTAALGATALVRPETDWVLVGLAALAVGTFLAQAVTTGFVGRAARADRGAANGLYLASYFTGGLAGSAALGAVFDMAGWGVCVAGVVAALLVAAGLTTRFVVRA